VLAVVQYQHGIAAADQPRDVTDGVDRLPRRRAADRQHVQRADHRTGDVAGVPHATERDEPHPSAPVRRMPGRGLGGQPGLPRAARSDHGDQPAGVERPRHVVEFVPPADETGQPRRQPVGFGAGRRHLAAQHREMDVAQLAGRVDAELVGEGHSGPLEHRQRVGLPSRRAQGAHAQADQAFPQRMRLAGRLQVGEHLGVPPQL
jgi:hypothetical protein